MAKETISSLQHSLVKNVVRLQQKASARREQNLFVIEGRREVSLALKAGIRPINVIICDEIYAPEKSYEIDLSEISDVVTPVTKGVYEKIAYRGDTQGVIMIAPQPQTTLKEITLPKNPMVIVLESVEKPGNLGGILRTADAAGVDAIIVCDPHTDIFNPNVIRSGLGCLFSIPVALCTNDEAYKWLNENKIKIFSASLQAAKWYHETDLTGAVAMAFGSESKGLTQFWYDVADKAIQIPMLGKIDSLNVSTSVAVMVYEAQRQRGFKS